MKLGLTRLDRFQAAGIGQHIHGGGRSCSHQMSERPTEILLIPTGEYGNARHGLGARRVIVENDQHPVRRGHGGGDSRGTYRHLGREICEKINFTYQGRLPVDPIGRVREDS